MVEFFDISLFNFICGDDRVITDEYVLFLNKGLINVFIYNALNTVGNKLKGGVGV